VRLTRFKSLSLRGLSRRHGGTEARRSGEGVHHSREIRSDEQGREKRREEKRREEKKRKEKRREEKRKILSS
jgi:hypothetical protein